jgi:hypothetical protein
LSVVFALHLQKIPERGDEVMDEQSKKDRRATIFKSALDKSGVPEWGRGASIVKATGCSPASAQAWIRGSLPSDGERIVELCDLYHIDLYLWVTLATRDKAQPIDTMLEAIVYVKDFEEKSTSTLTPSQFSRLCGAYLDESNRASFDAIVAILAKD